MLGVAISYHKQLHHGSQTNIMTSALPRKVVNIMWQA